MPVVSFHPRRIASLPYDPARQIDYYDATARGFGLRVNPCGTRTWFVILRVSRIVRRLKLGTYPALSLAAARRAARSYRGQADQGIDAAKEKYKRREGKTFIEMKDLYIEKITGQFDTWEGVKSVIERDIAPRFRAYMADEVVTVDVVEMLDELNARAPSAARKALEAMRQMYNFAIRRGIVKDNPATMVEAPTRKRKRKRFLMMNEIVKIIQELTKEPFSVAAALIILLLTSCRLEEILSLQRRWISLKEKHLLLTDTKNEGLHAVPITPLMATLITKLLLLADDEPTAYLFESETKPGVHLSGSHLRRRLKEVLERAGVDPTWLHDLRRSGATHFGRLRVRKEVIAKQLNHTGTSVTDRYNLWEYWEERSEAMQKWEADLLSYPEIRTAIDVILEKGNLT